MGENFSSVSRKKLAGISELLSKSPYEFFWGKHHLLKYSFSWFFPDLSGNFSDFCWIYPAWFSKLLSTCLDEHFDGIRFYKEKNFYLHFPITGGKTLAWCRNFSSAFVISAIFVSIETFWGKLFLLEKLGFLTILRPWAKNFQPSFKKLSVGLSKLHSMFP